MHISSLRVGVSLLSILYHTLFLLLALSLVIEKVRVLTCFFVCVFFVVLREDFRVIW